MEKIFDQLAKCQNVFNSGEDLKKIMRLILQELRVTVGEDQVEDYLEQLKILCKKFNNKQKILSLKDKIHRAIVIELIVSSGLQFYNYSYLNRARLSVRHLEILKEVGPFLFIEGVMIVSKLNVIYKNYSKIFTQDQLYQEKENSIDAQIMEILKMCDLKKRSVNNNLKKLQFLFSIPQKRVELIRELGKMLRDSWKKDKCTYKMDQADMKILDKQKEKDEVEEQQAKNWKIDGQKQCQKGIFHEEEMMEEERSENYQYFDQNQWVKKIGQQKQGNQILEEQEFDKHSQEQSILLKQYSFAERYKNEEDQFYLILGEEEQIMPGIIF